MARDRNDQTIDTQRRKRFDKFKKKLKHSFIFGTYLY